MIIAILTPSRGRVSGLKRFIESVNDTKSKDNTIIHFIGIDNNDPNQNDYIDMIHDHSGSSIYLTQNQKPVGIIWNDLYQYAKDTILPDYYIMGNDDLVYKTKEWDKILVNTIQELRDPYYVLWFNDGINGEDLAAFPIVSKEWIEVVGEFCPTIFEFLCNDLWIFDIAKRLDHLKFIPQVETEHLHFSQGKSPFDGTYHLHRDNGATGRDLQLFKQTEKQRIEIVNKLKLHIWK